MTALPGGVDELRAACSDADGADPFQHADLSSPLVVASHEERGRLAAVAWGASNGEDRWSLAVAVVPEQRKRGFGTSLVREVLVGLARHGAATASAWTTTQGAATDRLAYAVDAVLVRRMHKLAVALPLVVPVVLPEGYRLAPFADADLPEVIAVNAAAFVDHPEQAAMSADEVRAAQQEPWFDREGFLVLHGPRGIAGFCWTKLHAETGEGEIYVICTAPSEHGKGLGRAITVAGLAHLAKSTSRGMLYTEETNIAARRLYRTLGFGLERVDALYTARF